MNCQQNTAQQESPSISYDTCVNYPMIKFSSEDYENKLDEVQEYIIKKARQAKIDRLAFETILQPVCLKRGKYFQSALKIKSSAQEDYLSLLRTVEKVVYKQHAEKFVNELQQKKEEIITEIAESPDYNKTELFKEKWTESISDVEKIILEGKMQIPFSVGDLLRGKAMFKSRADIVKTVKEIEERIEKWSDQKCCILQTEDRLQMPTKDFKMLLLIGDTIAELQLAKETNKQANEFNHKIYELKRSQSYTPLLNLWIINERLTEVFFTDQLEFCFHMMGCEDEQFIASQN